MISQTVEYALRAVVTLAQHDPTPCTAQKIAEITRVPGPYLSKLMGNLVRAGMVRSQRGLHGGFVLTTKPNKLTIWDVIDAVEPVQRIHECPVGLRSHAGTLCPLHRRLDDAMGLVEKAFKKTSLSELLSDGDSVTPLCEDRSLMQLKVPKKTPEKSKATKNTKKSR
jgi:Rrf2 family nitric oxide-sensitive transcriptional repressor